jgi:hypothetical protein
MYSRLQVVNKRQVETVIIRLTKGCELLVAIMAKKVMHHLHIKHQIIIINNLIITSQTDLVVINVRVGYTALLLTSFCLNHNGDFKCT